MLTQVRDVLKGAMAWFFVVLLILAFALWGVPELRQFAGSSAVTVGGEQFSGQYVQNEFNRAVQIRRQESGGDFTREDALAIGLQDQVVNQIATRAAVNQYTERLGLAMPREVVRDFLQQNENYQNPGSGKFDRLVLESILRSNNMTVSEFERRIAEQLMSEQLISAMTRNGPAPKPLVTAMLLREIEKRTISYLTVTNDMSGVAAEPTPTDLETYYQENEMNFTAPEFRTFDYLALRRDVFTADLQAPEEERRRLYEANTERLYDQPERRTIYQMTYDTEAEAQASAAALKQGVPFENIAAEKNRSLDAVTFTDAQKRDILDPAVADAAFAEGLSEGDIVGPVQSIFGFTVVQIAGITPPSSTSYEEVRDQLEADYLQNDARRELLNAIDEIEEERDTGASLATAAEAAGFEVQTFGPVDRYSFEPGGAIIDDIPGEALAEVFSLDEGDESQAMELANNEGYFFVSLREITPPALKPFEDVRDEVETAWRQQERAQRISDTVRRIREAVEGGATLEETAATFDRAPVELTVDRRFDNDALSNAFVDQVFYADLGQLVSGPSALGQAQVVAQVLDISYADSSVTYEQEELYKQYLGYQLDEELLESFVTAIREDYGVTVNNAQMETLFGDVQ
jgi:peptidyl-prolyl cis-trans isomerase D